MYEPQTHPNNSEGHWLCLIGKSGVAKSVNRYFGQVKLKYAENRQKWSTKNSTKPTTQKSKRISNFTIFNSSREKIVFLFHFDVLEPSENSNFSNFRFVLPNFDQVFRPKGSKMYTAFFSIFRSSNFRTFKISQNIWDRKYPESASDKQKKYEKNVVFDVGGLGREKKSQKQKKTPLWHVYDPWC